MPITRPESKLVQKGLPCPKCGGSDPAAEYDDGHVHCFSCGKTWSPKGGQVGKTKERAPPSDPALEEAIASGQLRGIRSRKLTQETARFWGYLLRETPRGIDHLAPYRDAKGRLLAIKVRHTGTPEEPVKDFVWLGDAQDNLYGRHLWNAGGKILTILEGEIDTMTVSQANSHKFPVVGIPHGAANAAKAIAKNLDWINTFDKVVIGFDMDAPGREACVEAAKLLPPGKAFIAKWSHKDPNEVWVETGSTESITRAVWNAEAYRPDGILDARTLTERCLAPVVVGLPWPWKFMTDWTYGRRRGEVYTFGAGTGVGKTDMLAEVIACTITGQPKDGQPTFAPEGFAVFGFEAGPATTKKQIAGKIGKRRFHIPHQEGEPAPWTQEELAEALRYMDEDCWNRGGKLFINDSFGAADWEECVSRARFLRHAEDVRHFAIDPISALVTGEEDERKLLDKLVLESSKLAVELESDFYLMSHLTRPSLGASHEEGGQVRLSQFRGSNGISMFSTFVMGQERNQQAENPAERSETTFRELKDRYTGNSLGKTAKLYYDILAGTLDAPLTKFIGDTGYEPT